MNIADAKKVIKAAYLANDTVIMEGVHGIGKSNIVKQFAKDENFHCVELFLSHMEVGDLIGMPRTLTKGTEVVTTWTKPIWLQRMIDEAWPERFEASTIRFADKKLEEEVTSICTDMTSRVALNEAYCKVKGIDNSVLQLVSNQKDITCTLSRESVLFLDELNRAPIDVRQSSLQLVLEKQIHEHSLPYVNGIPSLIVAAINPVDSYQVETLDAALLDRFLHIEVTADASAWLDWARASTINPIVRDFIAENPKKIHFTPNDVSQKGATPRAWAKLASFMDVIDQIPRELHHVIMKGKIGSALASEFLTYYNTYSKAIKMADVEKHIAKTKKKFPDDIQKVGDSVKELMKDQEVVQKNEMAKQFIDKYIGKTGDNAYPLLAYLYGMELETRAAILKELKANDLSKYQTIAKLDAVNNKQLFHSIANVATKEQE